MAIIKIDNYTIIIYYNSIMKFQKELVRNNKVWQTFADDQLYISGSYTPTRVMQDNPTYSKKLLQDINKYGITIDSQEVLCDNNPFIHNKFIKYNSKKIKIDLSKMNIRKISQISYLEIIFPKVVGDKIFKELYNSSNICVEIQTDLDGIKSNPSMKLLREEHKRKFNINAINLTCIEFTNSHTNETIYLRDTNHHSFEQILSDDWDPNDIEVASLMLIGIDNNINVNDIIRTILSIINPVISHTHC